MKTEQLKELPQAVAFLDRLKAINPGYDIEIIEPKKRWPDIDTRKLPKVMVIAEPTAISVGQFIFVSGNVLDTLPSKVNIV